MIDINWAASGVIIAGLFSLLSLASWVGMLSEKVKRNQADIRCEREQNRQDHRQIFDKLDALRDLIKNNYQVP